MKKILIIRASAGSFGGVENQICSIADGLKKTGRFELMLATSDENSVFAKKFSPLGKVVAVKMGVGDIIKSARFLSRLVKKEKIEIIQSHMLRESFIGRAIKFMNPSVKHIFRVHTYIDNAWIPAWKKQIYHLASWLASPLVDIYMPASEFAKTELMRRSCISSGKIELVPESISQLGGPDPSIYESNELPKLAAMIARLFPHKGHSVLIEALAELKKRGLNIKVKLIGGGNDAKLKDDAALLGVLDNLEFCGFVENIYPVIKAVPVILLPSDMEGMPICVIEAMSVRKLVAASSVGGVPEIIKDGFNGFLHPPQNPSALADILEKIYKSPPGEFDRIRENGYKTWLEKFQLSSMIDGFIRVYRKL